MPSLQHDGRIGETEIFINLPIHIAWGRGDPDWDDAYQPEPIEQTNLLDEVGRRTATQVQFVFPDAGGEIETPDGNYRLSATPTRWAHVRVVFDYDDAVGEEIREVGVFFNTQTDPLLPAGQRYFEPSEIVDNGRLKILHHLQNKIVREGGVRQSFEYVLPF